jgi:hypothetical protein
MMSKKAELTTTQLVTLIVLILSFVVILFFLFRLDLGKETTSELCRNSVLLRGSVVVPTDSIPLDCSREYICISESGSCEKMTKPELKKVKTDYEVYQILAEEMANCWWMFGEGKVDYIGEKSFRNNYCSICSQIVFDESIKNIPSFSSGQLDKNLFFDYLKNEKYSESQTYSEYLFGTNDLNSFKESLGVSSNSPLDFGTIDFSKSYFVVMGIINEPQEIWKWGSAGAGVGLVSGLMVGFFTTTPIGWAVGAVVVGTSAIVGGVSQIKSPEILAITIEGKGIPNKFLAPTIIEANSEKFDLLNCEEILTKA